MMSSAKVKVVTKSKDEIQGILIPHEDIKEIVAIMSEEKIKECFFIFTGKKVSFIHCHEIESMIGLKSF